MSAPDLLAVAHGSRDDASVPVLEGLLARVRTLLPDVDVRLSYVDHRRPSVQSAVSASKRPTVVVPLLLSAATHSKTDVAGAVRGAGRPDLVQARPLAPHVGLIAALDRRLTQAGVGEGTAVVLAAVGSADPDANAEVVTEARRLWEWRGGDDPVEAGFASATRPRIDEALDRLRRLGHHRIAVASYAIAPGLLLDRAVAGLPVAAVTAPLGDTDEVAGVVRDRYAEALAGEVRMGCDTCMYRVAWPGREDRVGAAQPPGRSA